MGNDNQNIISFTLQKNI